jgi:UDP-N-acetylglucosamine:LPS N-acetylglucosamine transferase
VVVTQPGDRSDTPHRLAYASATQVLAPWPAGVHGSPAAGTVIEVGGISRFDGRERQVRPTPGTVLVLGGGMGERDLAAAAAATPRTRWQHAGSSSATWVDDPWEALLRAEVVVTAAGQNSVADLAAADARAVVIPQPRPFDEQVATGQVLTERRLAVVEPAWPAATAWPELLEQARSQQPDWSQWMVNGAARRAAEAIAQVGA